MRKRERPYNCPELELTGSSKPVTFHFVPKDANNRGLGWALATINDRTGELLIMSDWGNWSFRWNTRHLGPTRFYLGPAPHVVPPVQSLMEFVGDRGAVNYLADKLTSTDEQREFDPDETVAEFKRRLLERRMEWARENDDDATDWRYTQRGRERDPLTRALARDIWDALDGEMRSTQDETLFIERFRQIDGHGWISEEPWECTVHRPSFSYLILLHGILPAVRDAALAHLRAYRPPAPSIGWSGDLALLGTGAA